MIERKRLKPPKEKKSRKPKSGRKIHKPQKVVIDVAPEKSKGGRPPVYQKGYPAIAEKFCELGASDANLADLFDVSTTCIRNWQVQYQEFGEAVRRGKNIVFDSKVERSLAQKAIGYEVDTEEVKVTKDGDLIRYPIRKHYPPDTVACIFWLKNRQPQAWKDVQDHRYSGKVDLSTKTAEELREEINKELVELGLSPKKLAGLVDPKVTTNGSGTKH